MNSEDGSCFLLQNGHPCNEPGDSCETCTTPGYKDVSSQQGGYSAGALLGGDCGLIEYGVCGVGAESCAPTMSTDSPCLNPIGPPKAQQ